MGSAAMQYAELSGAEPTPLSQHPAFIAWRAAAAKRYGTVSVFPSGPHKGKLAERYKDRSGKFRYDLPPLEVRRAEAAILNREALDRRKGDIVRVAQAPGKAAAKAVVALRPGGPIVNSPAEMKVLLKDSYQDFKEDLSTFRGDVASVPRKAVSELLGIPEWLIPIAAIGTGLILLSGLYDRVRD